MVVPKEHHASWVVKRAKCKQDSKCDQSLHAYDLEVVGHTMALVFLLVHWSQGV